MRLISAEEKDSSRAGNRPLGDGDEQVISLLALACMLLPEVAVTSVTLRRLATSSSSSSSRPPCPVCSSPPQPSRYAGVACADWHGFS